MPAVMAPPRILSKCFQSSVCFMGACVGEYISSDCMYTCEHRFYSLEQGMDTGANLECWSMCRACEHRFRVLELVMNVEV